MGSRDKGPGGGSGGEAPGSPCVFQCKNSIFNETYVHIRLLSLRHTLNDTVNILTLILTPFG